MALRPISDLGAPAVVALLDIATSEKKPNWNRPLGIIVSLAGYVTGAVARGGMGEFAKQMGVGSFSWAIGSLYAYTKEVTPMRVTDIVRSPVSNKVGRYPAPHQSDDFQNIRLV